MFHRKNRHETVAAPPEPEMISPIGDRPFNFLYKPEDDPSRRSRVEAYYCVESADGNDYNVQELIEGRTVTNRVERISVKKIEENMKDVAYWARGRLSPKAGITATCLIEYPRANESDPIDAVAFSGSSDGLSCYEIKEVNGTIVITGRGDNVDERLKMEWPKGTRLTVSGRSRIPANGYPASNATESTFEENLMDDLRGAMIDYDETYPKTTVAPPQEVQS